MINWVPFSPKAMNFLHTSNARLNICHGAVRSAKTISCTVRWLTYLATGPRGDLAMLGKTMATLRRNVLNDLFDIVGPRNYRWVNKQEGELILLNRRIYCFGANNEDAESKIRGATFAGSYCDEASLYPQSVFNQLMARMSVRGASCFCNTNPDSPYHWLYTDYIMSNEIKDKKVWQFLMEDNLSLDAAYVESLKQMYKGVWYERMIEGKWVAAEGRIYDMFAPNIHLIDTWKTIQLRLRLEKIHPNAVRYFVACDYGTSTVMSWGLYCKLPDGTVYKICEYYYDAEKVEQQKTDGEFASEFVNWLANNPTGQKIVPWAVYVDPSAASWKLELMRRGYRVLNANNDVIDGIRHVSNMLGLANSSGVRGYYIDKRCINTEKEYSSYVWDKQAQLRGEDKPLKYRDHTCDTDRYALYTESQGALTGVYEIA